MGKENMFLVSPGDLPEVFYLVPDVEGEPNPQPYLAEGFVTEDGRVPVYIRDAERAREEYERLIALGLIPLTPGKALSEAEFVELVVRGTAFEVSRRNDPNDDGFQVFFNLGDTPEALKFYHEQVASGNEVRTLSEVLDEQGFAVMATEGKTVNLAKERQDGSVRVYRGIIIGASEGGGFVQPSLARILFGGK